MRVAAAQAHPVWLDAPATAVRVVTLIERAADESVDLVAFPETFLPGYPFWVMLGGVDRFNAERQKDAYAAYVKAAVDVGGPEVGRVVDAARRCGVFVYLGIAERAHGSVFASLLAIDPERGIVSCHRKLMPTYAERTVWALGDGNGLRVHHTGALRVGGLNCWENWMPQARLALYADGEQLHVAVFPGSAFAVNDLARFIAQEGRVWVVAASGLLTAEDVAPTFPFHDLIAEKPAGFYNGGSAIAAPDGTWAVDPVVDTEQLVVADVDEEAVLRARQTFDPAGHYGRPDVFGVRIDRRRLGAAAFED